MGMFKIDVDEFEWIGGAKDDPQDLCLHGHVTVHIGGTVFEDIGTVSATALYLLKTLTEDKVMTNLFFDTVILPLFTALVNIFGIKYTKVYFGTIERKMFKKSYLKSELIYIKQEQ